jgi:hypothetical protein
LPKAVRVSVRAIERVRQRFVEEGLEAALLPRPSPRIYARKLDGAQEAKLVALACSGPPTGKKRWTLRLLAERMMELEVVPELSHESVTRGCARRSKNNARKPHLRPMWCIPPKHSAAFVFHMEDVLEVYHRPHDAPRPVVWLDECSKQLVGEVRTPLPPCSARDDRPGRAECYDRML